MIIRRSIIEMIVQVIRIIKVNNLRRVLKNRKSLRRQRQIQRWCQPPIRKLKYNLRRQRISMVHKWVLMQSIMRLWDLKFLLLLLRVVLVVVAGGGLEVDLETTGVLLEELVVGFFGWAELLAAATVLVLLAEGGVAVGGVLVYD